MKWRCPHCGNTDKGTIESNGGSRRNGDLTLLCVARVSLRDSSWDRPEDAGEPDAAGLVACGAQWDPADQDDAP